MVEYDWLFGLVGSLGLFGVFIFLAVRAQERGGHEEFMRVTGNILVIIEVLIVLAVIGFAVAVYRS